jgi:hypothetical protein
MDNACMPSPRHFDALLILSEAGAERDAVAEALGHEPDDSELIRAVLRSAGGPGRDRGSVDALARLAAVIRAAQAAVDGRIDLDELRNGLHAHARATGDFHRLGPARSLVRTAKELLADESLEPRRVLRQVELLQQQLCTSLAEQLLGSDGSDGGEPTPIATDPATEFRVTDQARVRELDALVDEWLDPDLGDARRATWIRGWSAVPIAGGLLGDDEQELARLTAPLDDAGATELIRVKLTRPSRFIARGRDIVIGDGLRIASEYPVSHDGVRQATHGDRGRCLFTDAHVSFVILEDDEFHVVAGAPAVVEAICGCPATDALAAFREYVESITDDDIAPERLLAAAHRFGHGRRRNA